MVKKVLLKAYKSWKTNQSFSEKISLLSAYLNIHLKKKLKRSGKKDLCRINVLGLKIAGYDYRMLEYLLDEIFLSQEYHFKTSNPEPLIIDCGANIGFATLYFKRLYPHSKVISFEANPYTCKLLDMNVENNHLSNVEVHNVALSDKDGEVSFFFEKQRTLRGSLKSQRGGEIEITCKAVRLSNYLRDMEKVDLIKMDVEGAETLILKDLSASDQLRKIDQLLIEYHHNMENEESQLAWFLKVMEDNGFNYNIRTNYNALGDFQDIFIHFKNERAIL